MGPRALSAPLSPRQMHHFTQMLQSRFHDHNVDRASDQAASSLQESDLLPRVRVDPGLDGVPQDVEDGGWADDKELGQPLRVVLLADVQEYLGQARVAIPVAEGALLINPPHQCPVCLHCLI